MVLPKCKTFHVRISYSPNITQIERFFSISFARDFSLNIGFPPDASNLQSKIKLKSPPKTIFFCYNHHIFQAVFVEQRKQITAQCVRIVKIDQQKVCTIQFSIKNQHSSIFVTLRSSVPQWPIATPQELLFPYEKKEVLQIHVSILAHHLTKYVFLVEM